MAVQCEIQRGFFMKRACPKSPSHRCSKCGLMICKEHRSPDSLNKVMCVECQPASEDIDGPRRYRERRPYYNDHHHHHGHHHHDSGGHYAGGAAAAAAGASAADDFDQSAQEGFGGDDSFGDDAGFDDAGDINAFDS